MYLQVFEHKFVRGWPNSEGKPPAMSKPYTLEQFKAAQDSDAMVVPYVMPGEKSTLRLNVREGALESIELMGGAEPELQWVLLDFDREGHAPWDSLEQAEAHLCALLDDELGLLPEQVFNSMGLYSTRAGWRLMWKLSKGMPVRYANAWLRRFGQMLEECTGLDVDSASYEWTRLMRLPRACRDGVVLASFIDLEPISDGETLDWQSLDFPMEEAKSVVVGQADRPCDLPELTWRDRAAAADYPWVLRGQPIPANENGSTYEVLRSAIAGTSASGNITDPDILFAIFFDSVNASGRDLDEVWRLAEWTASQQEANAEESAPVNPDLEPKPVSAETWKKASSILGSKSAAFRNIREGMPLAANPRDAQTKLYQAARQLAMHGLLEPHVLFSVLFKSAQEQRAPMPAELWERCVSLAAEYEDMAKGSRDEAAIARAFCAQHPLLLKLPGTKQVFILNASEEPPNYEVTDTDTVLVQARRGFHGLPFVPTLRGEGGLRPLSDLLYDYGDVVTQVDFESGTRGCRYDSLTKTMFVGVHSVDPHLKSEFNPEVDEWLRRLAGDQYPDLEAWLACLTFTVDEPLAALYLDGPPGCGKSQLAATAARVWGRTTAPSEYSKASVARFNKTLTRCPLVFADEGIRVAGVDQYKASEVFRTLVSEMAHQIEPKGKEEQTLHGALRVMIAANGPDGVPFRKALDGDGLAAITERIMYIQVPRNPVQDPDKPNGESVDALALWLRARARRVLNAVPSHLLWLRDTVGEARREAPRSGRFLVSGHMTDWHRKWAANQGFKVACLEVVDKLLRRSRSAPAGIYIKIDWEQRVVLAHGGTVYESWGDMATARNPGRSRVNDTLRQMSMTPQAIQRRFGSERKRVWSIPWTFFIDTGVWDELPTPQE